MENKGTGTVLELARFVNDIRHPAISEVEAYWRGLSEDDQVPRRSALEPREIQTHLDQVFIAERVTAGLSRFRLAGRDIADVMGMEVRGMPMTSFMEQESRRRLSDLTEAVFQGPGLAELELVAEPGVGRPNLSARLLILPLRSDLGDVSRALGVLSLSGQVGRSPRKFSIKTILRHPLSAAPITSDPIVAPNSHHGALHEARASYQAQAPRPARTERPHLRLVKSDNS